MQCGRFGDRISCMVIYRAMSERADRVAIPLISYEGGLVLAAEKLTPLCVFGADGATMNYNCRQPGEKHSKGCVSGCGDPPEWCSINAPILPLNNCPCGFMNCGGRPRPWKPEHVGYVLERHQEIGMKYRKPGYHSGYNEVVVDAAPWRGQLPGVVRAFFFVDGGPEKLERKARQAHIAFLRRYRLEPSDVPMLRLRPTEWAAPFQEVANEP